jgi:hypothetical protein
MAGASQLLPIDPNYDLALPNVLSGFTDPSFFPFFTVFAFAMVLSLLRIFFFFLLPTLLLVQFVRQTVTGKAQLAAPDSKAFIKYRQQASIRLAAESV